MCLYRDRINKYFITNSKIIKKETIYRYTNAIFLFRCDNTYYKVIKCHGWRHGLTCFATIMLPQDLHHSMTHHPGYLGFCLMQCNHRLKRDYYKDWMFTSLGDIPVPDHLLGWMDNIFFFLGIIINRGF